MGGLDRLTLALNPQSEDERQAVKQLAVLDEATLALLHHMLDRERQRPIVMVTGRSDDHEYGDEDYDDLEGVG